MLEAGRPDYRFDVFVHMPAALTFPIGSKYYDWKYESEPEPFMNGRRIYHARGKILGGSSSINGMIFQRGNPLDYERWAADPGMDTWDYAHCLPYFRRMETCLAADLDDPFRGHAGPLVLERGPASNPLFGAFFEAVQAGRLPAHRRRQRLPPGGLRALRPEHPQRPPAERVARLPAPGDGPPEPRGPDPRLRHADPVRGHARRRRRVRDRQGRGPPRVRAARSILAGGAINSPQLLQLSGVGNADELTALGISPVHDLPGVGEHLQDHLEVYVQYGSKLPVSMQPSLQKWRRPWIGVPVAVPAHAARARRTTSRAAASPAATTTSRTRT